MIGEQASTRRIAYTNLIHVPFLVIILKMPVDLLHLFPWFFIYCGNSKIDRQSFDPLSGDSIRLLLVRIMEVTFCPIQKLARLSSSCERHVASLALLPVWFTSLQVYAIPL